MNQTTAAGSSSSPGAGGGKLCLAALLLGDLTFLVLHLVNERTLKVPQCNLQYDQGFAELFQYGKQLGSCVLLLSLRRRQASRHYLAWLPVFGYLLLDDAFGIHEVAGHLIAPYLRCEPLLAQDLGELIVTATSAAFLAFPLALAYQCGSAAFRRCSRDLVGLLLGLAFFGVAVDMTHAADTLEEFGEMAATSLVLGYLKFRSAGAGELRSPPNDSVLGRRTSRSPGAKPAPHRIGSRSYSPLRRD